ncbi:MAG: valine--tRNA ligase [Crenarchaeota archaeon]|nr:valine--tRNA ligase [Thermoproteota archaeon]
MLLKPRIREKHWDKRLEEELLETWRREGLHQQPVTGREERILVIDTPPPYPSGKWHVGGTAHYAQIDMIARFFRMRGWAVRVPWYADRNGLPVEVAVEKKYHIVAHEMAKTKEGRLKFLELCRKELDKVEEELVRIWSRLGCSFEYWRDGTDSPRYRRMTQATFIELWRRGLIYEAERPVNWCPRCMTSLSEAEIEYRDEEGALYYVRWRVAETGEEIVIATTRPELTGAAVAVAYNPEDERYKHLKGRHAVVPLYGYKVPIIEHESIDPSFGTGIMMVCTYGDWRDEMIVKELGLTPRVIITPDGRMSSKAGPVAGLPIAEARRRIVELFEEKGLLVKKEPITHSVPVCWRCKTPVEIIHVKEYFLKQLDYKEELLKIVDEMKILPRKHREKLIDWIKSLKMDWPISRTRYYGTEIPLWRCRKCGAKLVPEPGRYYRPWLEEPPWEKCPVCGAPREMLEGEKRVFDTWFDSSISVLYASGYMREPEVFEKVFSDRPPYTLRPQGVDIIRTWLYFTILRVYQLTGKPAFRWVRITGMGLDPTGRAMHKSLGNVIDPEPYIAKYGADAFRFWAAAAAKLGDDYRFSEQVLKTGYSFATKLWNIARFVSAFPDPEREGLEYRLRPVDLAVLSMLNKLVEECIAAYESLDVYVPATSIYQYTWNLFASHYIEMVKTRAYNRNGEYSEEEQRAAWYTLHRVVETILRLLAPIMPFVTDALYRRLYGESVHRQRFPEPRPEWESGYRDLLPAVMELNSAVWGFKKKNNIRLSQPLPGTLAVSEKLKPFARELEDMHHTRVVVVGSRPEGAIELTDSAWLIPGEAGEKRGS